MKKRCKRKIKVPRAPAGLRPKLTGRTRAELSMVHHITLDAIARGGATRNDLLAWIGCMMLWITVSRMMEVGQVEMDRLHETVIAVTNRYKKTGAVGFSGVEYQAAKDGVAHMDELAAMVDADVASAAAEVAEVALNRISEVIWPEEKPTA